MRNVHTDIWHLTFLARYHHMIFQIIPNTGKTQVMQPIAGTEWVIGAFKDMVNTSLVPFMKNDPSSSQADIRRKVGK
jgi:hypothetical protein